jgi:hypothetical protein
MNKFRCHTLAKSFALNSIQRSSKYPKTYVLQADTLFAIEVE